MSWKKCINQLDSYLFEKTIENLLIRQYVGILFRMGMRRCYRFSKYCTVWKKHQRKKKGREGEKKKITWSWEPSHIMNNLPRNIKKRKPFVSTVALSLYFLEWLYSIDDISVTGSFIFSNPMCKY